ncbi:MAG: hypothetical protein ACLUAR_18590 [Pilosibacter sp.]
MSENDLASCPPSTDGGSQQSRGLRRWVWRPPGYEECQRLGLSFAPEPVE